ncbi:MAG: hypothetical protein R2873_23790 [Caldilineaceae bacterium]
MSVVKRKFLTLLVVIGALLVLFGCAAPAEPQAGQESGSASQPAAQSGEVARADILVIPSNVNIPAPDIWNPYIPRHLHPAGDEPEYDGTPLHVEL